MQPISVCLHSWTCNFCTDFGIVQPFERNSLEIAGLVGSRGHYVSIHANGYGVTPVSEDVEIHWKHWTSLSQLRKGCSIFRSDSMYSSLLLKHRPSNGTGDLAMLFC
jgi:hypothetical protein